MRLENGDGFARLDEECFVIAQSLQRAHDSIVCFPRAGRATAAPVHDQILWPLRNLGI